jgi:hypothetical protein
MNINWNEWDQGGKIIFASSCLAIVSMIMPWVDIGIASSNGFSQGGFLLLGFYIYPNLKLLNDQKLNKKTGMILGIISVVLSLAWTVSNTRDFMGNTINVSGLGLELFVASSIALTIGIMKTSSVIVLSKNSNEF